MDKIIFLDIDGVLNCIDFLRSGRGYLEKNKVSLLNQLGEECKIVVSSTWGYDEGNTEKSLLGAGLKLPVIGYTRKFDASWACRGNEIEDWIRTNYPGTIGTKYESWNFDTRYNYVILDDECEFLLGQKDHLIQTDGTVGLTQQDINRAKEILYGR